MKQEIPSHLLNSKNKAVLDFIEGYSAHGDIAETLLKSVETIGDVQSYCPDTSQYLYLVVSTKGIIFGIAIGMHNIARRFTRNCVPPYTTQSGKLFIITKIFEGEYHGRFL